MAEVTVVGCVVNALINSGCMNMSLWLEAINMRNKRSKIVKTLSIDEQTYRRLTSTMNDMVHIEKRNLSYDDVINQLIDVYQERLALSGENAGG
jgi:hypothetical protein